MCSFHLSSHSPKPPAAADSEFCGENVFCEKQSNSNKSLNRFPHRLLSPSEHFFSLSISECFFLSHPLLLFSLSSLFSTIPILTVFMSALTKFSNVFSVIIYVIPIFFIFSTGCIFCDKPADLCAAFALLFSNAVLQPNSLQCWLSSSFDFFLDEICFLCV